MTHCRAMTLQWKSSLRLDYKVKDLQGQNEHAVTDMAWAGFLPNTRCRLHALHTAQEHMHFWFIENTERKWGVGEIMHLFLGLNLNTSHSNKGKLCYYCYFTDCEIFAELWRSWKSSGALWKKGGSWGGEVHYLNWNWGIKDLNYILLLSLVFVTEKIVAALM